ncbi:transcriptional regulator, IclR family [Monaibacterium marinum]|uniref:Transcriptional regulator, IclR family n=1 Tax=Pontivivens marinum TaxID=1690039 RepID=A0A2C9CSV9_9RHOB|nr:IclR family transcriptional regulator [Monaibacterium marinum]SOH94255.1 transcriptional regulator, IclR family [Monaibacterium marinum]
MSAGHTDGTVGKALGLLDMVVGFGRPVRFVEVQQVSDMPKATLYRLLQTLTNQRMLSYDEERSTYQPGLRLVQLAHSAWRQVTLAPVARPHLDALSAKLGETVHLAQLDGGQVLYIDKRNATRPISMFSDAGKIGPGYCTGVGKAMLAYLPEAELARALSQQSWFGHTEHTHTTPDSLRNELPDIRRTGISFDREEHEPTIICIAVPILDATQRPLGAMSITSSTLRHSLTDLERFAPDLHATASAIARDATGLSLPINTVIA